MAAKRGVQNNMELEDVALVPFDNFAPHAQAHRRREESLGAMQEYVHYQRPKRKNKRRLLKATLIGIVFNMVVAYVLHLGFEWMDCWLPLAAFVPTNESVFEHLNMNYWPVIWYSLIEFPFVNNPQKTNYYVISKFVNVTTSFAITTSVFYTYTMYWPRVVLIDAIIICCAIIIGQFAGYFVLIASGKPCCCWTVLSVTILIGYGLAFIVFTHHPLHFDIFVDAKTGLSGIQCE
eukprot:168431_1